ncbi:alpha-L-fucosidase, partial [Bacteroidales bacterium]
EGGKLSIANNQIHVDQADNVTLLYTVDTEYVQDYPLFKGVNPEESTQKVMNDLSSKSYAEIEQRHKTDYQNLYNRVKLSMVGNTSLEQLPTNERVAQLQKGMTNDASLKTLWFNLSRYLVISASRKGTLPSTLQGAWNTFVEAPWSGNFQSNINLQEMYWGCGPTNLPECEESYVQWIEGLVKPGRKTAQAYYGTNGWLSNATGNIWGFTAPGVDILWGIYPAGAAWHCRHLWQHYEFTNNKDYLKNKAYPIMKEAAIFWLENMTEYEGKYIIAPSVSTEHGIELKDAKIAEYSTTNGEVTKNKIFTVPAFQDIVMVNDLYSNVIKASEILDVDPSIRKQFIDARNKLMPLQIGKYGQLQEWILDADNPHDHHRHQSHLYALYPGNMISTEKTPELAQAARKSLELRGEGKKGDRWPHAGGNWSMAWKSALWSRLGSGDRAISIFNKMIQESGYENMMSNQSGNMQVDATMATCGIFAEMLMQSQDDFINILPALPTEWPEGKIEGLLARKGYIVNIEWKFGQLTNAEILIPLNESKPRVKLKGSEIELNDKRIVFN